MKEELENKCIQYSISRKQRADETARGEDTKGTMGFENMGCYSCDGHYRKCSRYYNMFEESLK